MESTSTSSKPTSAPDRPHLAEFMKFLESLKTESGRGRVLISTAMIDDLLRRTIESFLLDHSDTKKLIDGFNAPLGTLSSRSLAAHAMTLISTREYEEIGRLRKVRNRFAHDVHVSFEDQQIKDLCQNLTLKAHDYGDVVVSAQRQFTTSATALILNLTNRPHYVSGQRLALRDWPY